MPPPRNTLDSNIDVATPENIAFTYRAAGPFQRLPAFLIDVALRWLVIFVLGVILSIFGVFAALGTGGGGGVVAGMMMIAYFILSWFYGPLFETYMNGQTPGKRMVGIRVLTTDGRPINGMQAVLRNLLRLVDLFPVLSLEMFGPMPMYVIPVGLVGLAFMMANRRYQRIGDLVADTMVVAEERRWLMGIAKLEDPRAIQLAAYLPVQFQPSRSFAKALSTYVERRKFFSTPRRREIARHLGEPLLEEFGLPRDTSHDLLLCALYYRLFIGDRQDDEQHAAAIAAAHAPPGYPQGPYGYPQGAPSGYPPPGYPQPGYPSPAHGGGYPPQQPGGFPQQNPPYPTPQHPSGPIYIGPS